MNIRAKCDFPAFPITNTHVYTDTIANSDLIILNFLSLCTYTPNKQHTYKTLPTARNVNYLIITILTVMWSDELMFLKNLNL